MRGRPALTAVIALAGLAACASDRVGPSPPAGDPVRVLMLTATAGFRHDSIGAQAHPWTQTASVQVEDPGHPATRGLGAGFSLLEEFYTFQENPRARVQVLLTLDAASVGAAGDFPLAWTQTHGAGRSYYNALGHFPETWADPRFRAQWRGAIQWVAGRE